MTIFVSGSLAYDRIMNFPGKFADHILPEKIHILNVCFTVNGMSEKFGGTAGNIAYNLNLLEEKSIILAAVGRDFGNYEARLKELDLPLDGIRRVDEDFTAGAYITTDLSDNQITGFNPGAMKYPSQYRFKDENPNQTMAIISPGNIDDMVTYSQYYKRHDIPYIFDPGQQIPVIPKEKILEMIEGSQILIVNDYELKMIEKATERTKADLLDMTKAVIVTLGDKGSLVTADHSETHIPIVTACQVIDPTGAGDAYRAGLIKGLVTNRDLPIAARMGATIASFAVEKHGTQEHSFTRTEFNDRYRDHFA